MKNYTFSASTLSFYDNFSTDAYIASGTWPDDGKEVSDEVFVKYNQPAPEGKVLGSKGGIPAWVDAPTPTEDEIRSANAGLRDNLIADAKNAMFLNQTKLLLGKATAAEKQSLAEWVSYTDAVISADLSNPKWPEAPAL